MYCIYCGKQIKDNAKFCTFCGARTDEDEEKTEVILPVEEDKTEVILPVEEDKTELLVESDETEVLVENSAMSQTPMGNQNLQIQRPLKYMGHVIDEANVSQMMEAKEKTMKKKAGGMLGLMLFLLLVILVLGAWGFYAYYLKNNI